MEIPLSQAPSIFFEPDHWAKYVVLFSSEAAAIEALSLHNDGMLRVLAAKVARLPGHDGNAARAAIVQNEMKDRLLQDFLARFTAGELKLFGKRDPFSPRQIIAPTLINHMILDFRDDTARLGQQMLVAIEVGTAETTDSTTLVSCIAQWLVDERARAGQEVKKVLQNKAEKHFSSEFRVRDFDAAYTAVYQRRGKGRPPNNKK
jgi:hypothetical protein